jgi:hypothetical protein
MNPKSDEMMIEIHIVCVLLAVSWVRPVRHPTLSVNSILLNRAIVGNILQVEQFLIVISSEHQRI